MNYLLPASALLLAFIFVNPVNTVAQSAPAKQWDARFGGGADDSLTAVCLSPDGGYLLAGFSASPAGGDVTENSKGGTDYWVVKTDMNGVKLWDKKFGGNKNEYLRSVLACNDGGYLLGGYSFSGKNGDRSQSSRGKCDYWIVKTDGEGNKLWDARFGGKAYDYLFDMKKTGDGGFVLAGYSDSQAGGDMSDSSRGANDYWMVKIDAGGNKEWDHRYGGGSDDNLSCIIQTEEGGYLLGGLTHSKLEDGGDITIGVKGGKDYWIVKTDGLGIKQWDNRLGGSERDIMMDEMQTADGGFYLAGLSNSPVSYDVVEVNRGKEDFWLLRCDQQGYMEWNRRYGGASLDVCTSLLPSVDGLLIQAGFSDSDSSFEKSQDSKGLQDFWVMKTDREGNKLWDLGLGGNNTEVLFDAISTADAGYLLAGISRSGIAGDKTQNSRGGVDFWIVKLNPELITWYADQDHDGYGSNENDSSAYLPPLGYVALSGDCNDQDGLINPASQELCNGLDENCNQVIDDNAVAVTVTPAGTVASCENTLVTFTAAGDGISSYQWFRNGSLVPGQTNSTYSTKTGTSVFVQVSVANGCSGQSEEVTIIRNTVPPAMIILGNNGNNDLCNGEVELKLSGAELRTWQWNLNGLPVAGATSNKYYPMEAGSYTVLVTNTTTGCSKTSGAVTIIESCRLGDEVEPAAPPEIFPNPAGEVLNLKWNDWPLQGLPVTVRILDPLGHVLLEKNLDAAEEVLTLDLSNVAFRQAGINFLHVVSPFQTFTISFFKR
jgi:hypothetical protein